MGEVKDGDLLLAKLYAEAEEAEKRKERAKRIWSLIHIMTYCVRFRLEIPENYQN